MKNICFDGLKTTEIKGVYHYIAKFCNYLEKSMEIEPNFIDAHYNIAAFYLYNYLLGNRENRNT